MLVDFAQHVEHETGIDGRAVDLSGLHHALQADPDDDDGGAAWWRSDDAR